MARSRCRSRCGSTWSGRRWRSPRRSSCSRRRQAAVRAARLPHSSRARLPARSAASCCGSLGLAWWYGAIVSGFVVGDITHLPAVLLWIGIWVGICRSSRRPLGNPWPSLSPFRTTFAALERGRPGAAADERLDAGLRLPEPRPGPLAGRRPARRRRLVRAHPAGERRRDDGRGRPGGLHPPHRRRDGAVRPRDLAPPRRAVRGAAAAGSGGSVRLAAVGRPRRCAPTAPRGATRISASTARNASTAADDGERRAPSCGPGSSGSPSRPRPGGPMRSSSSWSWPGSPRRPARDRVRRSAARGGADTAPRRARP